MSNPNHPSVDTDANKAGLPFYLGTAPVQDPTSMHIYDAFFDAGGRAFDTGRVYGESERVLGQWIQERGVADEVIVLTKGAHPTDFRTFAPRVSAEAIAADLSRSLEVLGLERVDAFLLHRDDPAKDVGEIAQALRSVVDGGAAARIGVSNWTTERTSALVDELARIGGPRISVVSNYFGLARASGAALYPGVAASEASLLDLIDANGMQLLAWSAQSSGYFFGDDAAAGGSFATTENAQRRALLHSVADRHGTTPAALLVRWLVTGTRNVVPILGTSSAERVQEMARAATGSDLDEAVQDLVSALAAPVRDSGAWSAWQPPVELERDR